VHCIEGSVAIWRATVIAQVHKVVLRKCFCNRPENGKATITRIENTYGTAQNNDFLKDECKVTQFAIAVLPQKRRAPRLQGSSKNM
jgi:hypothetical protein